MTSANALPDSDTSYTSHTRGALAALSLGGFGIGLTEFIIAGLLSEVSSDLDVSISQTGNLVGGYALAVIPGALVITPMLMRRRPRTALAVLMAFFVVGNVLSAWSPTYDVMLIGRIVAAFAHGGYFGIGAVLAASLVPPSKKASAVSIMFAGLTVANVLGVPVGTVIGQQLGWRSVFWIISAIGATALVGLISLVPRTEPEPGQLGLGAQFRMLARPQILASLATTALVFGGMFGVFTFIEPLLREVTGYPAQAIGAILILFGTGLFVGNLLGGRAADRDPDRAVLVAAALLPLTIAALGGLARFPVPAAVAVFALGFVGFATVPGLQARVLRHAEGAATLASAANIAAFNLGNSIGVTLAGAAITAGYGWYSPLYTGVALTFIGLAVLVFAQRLSLKPR